MILCPSATKKLISLYIKNSQKIRLSRYTEVFLLQSDIGTFSIDRVSSKALGQLASLPGANKPVRSTIKNCKHPNPLNLFPLASSFLLAGSKSLMRLVEDKLPAPEQTQCEIHYISPISVQLHDPKVCVLYIYILSGGETDSSARVVAIIGAACAVHYKYDVDCETRYPFSCFKANRVE